jgi:hypothetical protein
MMAQESTEGYVILLKINHAEMTVPIRVASTNTNFLSNGETFQPFPFRIDLPGDDPEQISTVELSIDNVDGQITAGIRSLTPGLAPPTVTMNLVTMDAPDDILVGPLNLSLSRVSINRLVVSGSLTYEPILDRSYPSLRFYPFVAPGMF